MELKTKKGQVRDLENLTKRFNINSQKEKYFKESQRCDGSPSLTIEDEYFILRERLDRKPSDTTGDKGRFVGEPE